MLVVMTLVWNRFACSTRAGMMHWTSTSMTSTAPVATASSWCRKFPTTGRPLPHQDLVCRAADPADQDPLRPLLLGQFDQLGIAARRHDHLREGRLVAVDDDVHLVLFQDAEVDLAPHGLRRPEEDVAEVRGEHRAGPAVAQRGPQAVQDEVLVIGVDPLVGPMEGLDDLMFHADGNDTEPAATAPRWPSAPAFRGTGSRPPGG